MNTNSFSYAYSLKTSEVTLTNCDREPVHVPGCIQPWGALLALRPTDLTILQASNNAETWFGQNPEALIGKAFADVFGELHARALARMVAEDKLESLPRYVFSANLAGRRLEALAHMHDGLIVVECEAAEEMPSVAPDRAYAEVSRIAGRLQNIVGLQPFCQTLAEEVRTLTGLDRVMIYRFQEDLSGEVFAEAKRPDLHSYLTLRYPAEDIPLPAREIFRRIWVRPVPSIEYASSEIVPLLNPDSGKPLDMTYCFLRGASVMYTDYLKNMEVAMALTLSIVVDGKLWGLVACHHSSPKIIPWPVRAGCELLAQIASLQLRASEASEFKEYHDDMDRASYTLVERMLVEDMGLHALLQQDRALLDFMDADGVALLENGKWLTEGSTPPKAHLQALAEWVQSEFAQAPLGTEVLHTQSLSARFAPAAAYAQLASGMLAIPISRQRDHMILWFRSEVEQKVNWAGDPYEKPMVDGPGGPRLMPRSSFALWQESVRNQSLPWKSFEIETARRLRLAIMEVVVARAEQTQKMNKLLATSNAELDSFAYITSHDLREPLRGIYHYAYHLKTSAEERDDAESIRRCESLLSVTKRMDGLIESLLHFSRVGRTDLEKQEVPMEILIDEVRDVILASRSEKKPSICIREPLPNIQGDIVRMRELWLNLISNAVKYNDSLEPDIQVGYVHSPHGPAFYVRDDGIGIATENLDRIFEMFKRLHAKDDYGGGSGAGLPIVKKIVERHGGNIWVQSTPGEGTTFYFTLPQE